MPMLDIQRRHAEIFRLRFGDRGPDGYPRKLTEAIRITAPTEAIVAAFTATYGGEVAAFTEKTSRDRFQAYLPTTSIPIMVLPGQSLQQWWERYRKSVCDRRCDGETEHKSGKPCMCTPDIEARIADRQACAPTTRVSVLCPDVAVVGSGSFVTHGLIAAETLPQSIAVAEAALSRGLMVPAMLTISEVKGRNHFIYPQIVITGMSLHELMAGGTSATGELGATPGERLAIAGPQAALPAGNLTPVPTPAVAPPSIAEQVAHVDEPRPPSGRRTAQTIPATGVGPRTMAEVEAGAEPQEGMQQEAGDPGPVTPPGVQPGSAAAAPAPNSPVAPSVTELARLAGAVFKADYDAAPRGHKTKVIDRLRHAAVHVATKSVRNTTTACTPEERLRVRRLLDDIAAGSITYAHDAMNDDGGAMFTLLRPGHPEGDKTVTVPWSVLDAPEEEET